MRGDNGGDGDLPGYWQALSLADVRARGHVLRPGRYMGAEQAEDDGEPYAEKMGRLTRQLDEQFAAAARLEATISENLRRLGFDLGRSARR